MHLPFKHLSKPQVSSDLQTVQNVSFHVYNIALSKYAKVKYVAQQHGEKAEVSLD